jgi:hypothetical protein
LNDGAACLRCSLHVAYVLPGRGLIVALSGRRPTDEMTDVRLGDLGSSFRLMYLYFLRGSRETA